MFVIFTTSAVITNITFLSSQLLRRCDFFFSGFTPCRSVFGGQSSSCGWSHDQWLLSKRQRLEDIEGKKPPASMGSRPHKLLRNNRP